MIRKFMFEAEIYESLNCLPQRIRTCKRSNGRKRE